MTVLAAPGRWRLLTLVLSLAAWCGAAAPAAARVRLENICTLQGQEEVRLTGLGLVVGLTGTGDGAKNLPTVRALRTALAKMNQPAAEADFKNADSVAVVMLDATIPRTGLRRGQKIDCHVSAVMGAKSLAGGRLLSTPLTTVDLRSDRVIALAGGAISVEDGVRPTTGKVSQGVDLLQDVNSLFVQRQQGEHVTLLIDPHHASFWTASEVARVVNSEFTFEASGRQVARPAGPGVVEITIPDQYRSTPVDFIAQVLDVGIDLPHTQARVILNAKSGTVIVTGEVEISPVVIAHKSFSVEIGVDGPATTGPFVGLTEGQSRQSPQQLKALVDALNQLRVPASDIINIIRELHKSGKLHAELIDR